MNSNLIHKFVCLLGLVLLVLLPHQLVAQRNTLPDTLSSGAVMSILVAEPSPTEVYTLYGHAGFRVQDQAAGIDITFNYGIFDFGDSDLEFLARFVKGQTDYVVAPMHTMSYMEEYLGRGSQVTELVLNMNELEQARAWSYLLWNIRPENRTYRYSFFYDNCATRPLAIFAGSIANTLPHHTSTKPSDTYCRLELELPMGADSLQTWRSAINRLEGGYPWLVLGTDLGLGAETDAVMSTSDRAFLPNELIGLLMQSSISTYDAISPDSLLISRDRAVLKINHYGVPSAPPARAIWSYLWHPTTIFTLLLTLALLSLYRAYRKGTYCHAFHYSMLLATGLAGCILFYIAGLSEHAHRWPNYNLWVIHPLHLLALPLMALGGRWRLGYIYHFANFVAQCAFLVVAHFLPQHFNVAVHLASATLAVLSLAYILEHRSTLGKRRETSTNGAS